MNASLQGAASDWTHGGTAEWTVCSLHFRSQGTCSPVFCIDGNNFCLSWTFNNNNKNTEISILLQALNHWKAVVFFSSAFQDFSIT